MKITKSNFVKMGDAHTSQLYHFSNGLALIVDFRYVYVLHAGKVYGWDTVDGGWSKLVPSYHGGYKNPWLNCRRAPWHVFQIVSAICEQYLIRDVI